MDEQDKQDKNPNYGIVLPVTNYGKKAYCHKAPVFVDIPVFRPGNMSLFGNLFWRPNTRQPCPHSRRFRHRYLPIRKVSLSGRGASFAF